MATTTGDMEVAGLTQSHNLNDLIEMLANSVQQRLFSSKEFLALPENRQNSYNSQMTHESQYIDAAADLGIDVDPALLPTSTIEEDYSLEFNLEECHEDMRLDSTSSSSSPVRQRSVRNKPVGSRGVVLLGSLRFRMGIDEKWPEDVQEKTVRELRAYVKHHCGQDCRFTMSHYKDNELWEKMVESK